MDKYKKFDNILNFYFFILTYVSLNFIKNAT